MRKLKVMLAGGLLALMTHSAASAVPHPTERYREEVSPRKAVGKRPQTYQERAVPQSGAGSIQVTYPAEGGSMPYVRETFILGNVSPSTAAFYINSTRIQVYKNGAFLAYLPVSRGDFSFNCELREDGGITTLTRNIKVGRLLKIPLVPGPAVDPLSVSPSSPMELRPGDWLRVKARGTPGLKGEFSISGIKKGLPMFESYPGLYQGAYQIQERDKAKNAKIKITLRKDGGRKVRVKAPGTLTCLRSGFQIVQASTDNVSIRTGPRNGYMMFLPQGTRMFSDARIGRRLRIWLSETESGWVDSSKIKVLPPGSLPPSAVLGTIKTSTGTASSIVTMNVSQQVPFTIEEADNSIFITLYYTRGHTNWIIYDSSDTFIDSVRWKQTGSQSCRVTVALSKNQRLWGYDISYSGSEAVPRRRGKGKDRSKTFYSPAQRGRQLVLELSHPPEISKAWPRPLSGLNVIVDPGHSLKKDPPYDGAVGPMGTLEPQANLATARELEAELVKLGARVTLTRELEEEEVSLQERPRRAWKARGNIFISIHYNALPDGKDPFAEPHGFSVFYYHPHSMEFARAMHGSYIRNIPLADEGLGYGDLLVARITQMPSILVETAYMIFPEQEELINDPSFRKKTVSAMTEGIFDFFKISRTPPRARSVKRKKRHRTGK